MWHLQSAVFTGNFLLLHLRTRVALSLISTKVVLERQFLGKICRTLALVEIVLNLQGMQLE